jgi:transposase-like protein
MPTAAGNCSGRRVGDSEREGFWKEFLATLKVRSLEGVKL